MLLNLGWRGQFALYILFFSVNKALKWGPLWGSFLRHEAGRRPGIETGKLQLGSIKYWQERGGQTMTASTAQVQKHSTAALLHSLSHGGFALSETAANEA